MITLLMSATLCKPDMVTPIDKPMDTISNITTKFSDTISTNFTNLDLGGYTTATIN